MRYYLAVLCVFIRGVVSGCDFCGCFMGITPYDNQSSITLMYRYKSFNGYNYSGQATDMFPRHYSTQTNITNDNTIRNAQNTMYKHGNMGATGSSVKQYSSNDYEIYSTAELRGKYFIHKRLELNAIIPFIMNTAMKDAETQQIRGLGDITLLAAYHVISKTMTEKFQHRLIIGAGIKIPVGKYNAQAEDGDRIDFMLQSGTGSSDYLIYANYIFAYKKLGVDINSIYKFNGRNNYGEKISNSCTDHLNIFYKFRQGKDLKLFPSLQAYYEHSNGEYIGNEYQQATKMSVATAGAGLDIFYKNIALNASFQVPVYEKKFNGNLATAGKFMIGLTYSFDQKKYLIKSKQSS